MRRGRAQALANDSAFVRVAKGVYALRALAGSAAPAYKSPGRARRENLRPPRPPRAPAATLLLEAFEDDFDGEEEEEVCAPSPQRSETRVVIVVSGWSSSARGTCHIAGAMLGLQVNHACILTLRTCRRRCDA